MYRLRADAPLNEEVRRVAREELEAAVASLGGDRDLHDGVHDARKRLKKVRAVLRLVRDVIGEERYRADNVFYRDRGRELAEVRDARVAVETLDALRSRPAAALSVETFAVPGRRLAARFEDVSRRILDEERRHERVAAALDSSLRRVAEWPVEEARFETVAPGLRRVYARGRKARRKAAAEPTFERYHEWRKRVKDLWYHVRLLEGAWPEVLGGLAVSTHEVSDLIGDANDLSELVVLLRDVPSLAASRTEREALLRLIDRRRAELRGRAHPQGRRIWAESPKRFVRRMGDYWQATRAEPTRSGTGGSPSGDRHPGTAAGRDQKIV